MDIGGKIKQLRVKMDLTQEELAARCDLSKGFISQVERNLTSPSIATLVDILDCLGTNLKDFFNETMEKKIVFDKDDVFLQENQELGYNISWLITNAQKNDMEPILISIKPGGRSEEHLPFLGEVFGYVLAGAVLLHTDGEKYRVKKGESFYYKANTNYFLENTTKNVARVIWITSPPNF